MLTNIRNTRSDFLIRLSQKHLTILENCPRQFQDIYLEQLASITPSEQRAKQTWGKNFHLLMQQRELGLNLDNFLTENPEISRYFNALLNQEPELFTPQENQFREAEHRRTFSINDYFFTVIYDLLIANENQVQIIDWKTYLQPPKQEKLAKNWQTSLYLYALVSTSDYLPEQISFTYWFVKLPNKPEKITIHYDSQQHKKNHQDLTKLLKRLDKNLTNYFEYGRNFAHPSGNKKCKYCQSLKFTKNLTEEVYKLLNDDTFYLMN
jgi:hypothetical protein